MAEKTKIQWTDDSWNPVVGCSIISPGCKRCYAMRMAARLEAMGQPIYQGLTKKTKAGAVWTDKVEMSNWGQVIKPLSWRKPRRVFVNSMSDLFHESLPDDAIDKVFAVMALAPQHTFQILTKRSARMRDYIAQDRMGFIDGRAKRILRERSGDPSKPVLVGKTLAGTWPWRHVWLGVSVEDQEHADQRIPDLLATPAAVRFLSCEPLLGPLDLRRITPKDRDFIDALTGHDFDQCHTGARVDWVIVGGESGRNARPMELAWANSMIEQCKAAGVACFVKQLGAKAQSTLTIGAAGADPDGVYRYRFRDAKGGDPGEWMPELRVREFPAERMPA